MTDTPTPVPIASVPSRVEELRPVEPAGLPQEPPPPAVRELVVSADSVLGLQLETTVSSERARVEDRVDARVVRDVRVGSDVAIPAGARAIGSVMSVERGGRMKDRARLGIRFHTLVLADGTEVPITSETIYRNGNAPGQGSAAKIGGGAVAGAILGAILGGGKGAAIGGAAGAGAGTATVMASDRSEAIFQSGAELTARIVSPVTVIADR
jgi:type IV secretory pathway VirB10-like protein